MLGAADPREGARLGERPDDDEQAPGRVPIRQVVREVPGEGAVPGVAQHRVHHGRRVAEREQVPLPAAGGERDGHVGPVRAPYVKHGRQERLPEAGGVVRHDPVDALRQGLRVGVRVGDG